MHLAQGTAFSRLKGSSGDGKVSQKEVQLLSTWKLQKASQGRTAPLPLVLSPEAILERRESSAKALALALVRNCKGVERTVRAALAAEEVPRGVRICLTSSGKDAMQADIDQLNAEITSLSNSISECDQNVLRGRRRGNASGMSGVYGSMFPSCGGFGTV